MIENCEMRTRTYSQPRGVTGVSLLDQTGFGHVGVVTHQRADGTIMVIAHPRASKAQWDRAWERLPDVEVEEFDYHIRPDGTEVYVITPYVMVFPNRCDGEGHRCRCHGTVGCCA